MWKALLCLLLATATLSSAGRKRQHNRAPTFFNFRPEIVSDDEFIPLESSFPDFGLKAALDGAVDASDDSSAEDDHEGETKSAASPPTEVSDSDGDSDENDTPTPLPEHRAIPTPYVAKDHGHKKNGKDWDASYAFGYDLDDQSRHETSDPNGNVNGFYSFVDDEGTLRKVTYTAGAEKGFVILNKDKVPGFGGKRPKKPSYTAVETDSSNQDKKVYQTPAPASANNSSGDDDDDDGGSSGGTGEISSAYPGKPWGALAIKMRSKGGKKKKPIFVVKIRRPANKNFPYVKYRPRPPAYSPAYTFAPPLLPPYLPYLPYQLSLLSAAAPGRHPGGGPRQPPYGGDDDGEWQQPAATAGIGSAYSFGYDAGTSNRKEVADPYGNVRGSYSYIDPAGIRRTVNYIAGGTTGFKVLNASPATVQNIYEQAPPSYVPRRHGNRRLVPVLRGTTQIPQPSAIVYHIHPDGGWKPWEPKKPRRSSRKRANPVGKDSAGSASELTNSVQVDHSTTTAETIKENETPETETILIQTHPPQKQHEQQQQQQSTETTTFSTILVTPEEHRPQPQRVHTHGQRSWTGDDEEESYAVAYTSTPHSQSAEFHDATLFDPSSFIHGHVERFAVAEDTRHPVPAQLAAINGLNVQLRAYPHYGDKIQTSESKSRPVEKDNLKKEVMAGEATTMSSVRNSDSEMGGTTMSTTQVEKPRNRIEMSEDGNGGSTGEMTTMPPSSSSSVPSATSSSRRHHSKRKHSSSNKSHSQTVQRMTREQTTKTSADIEAETAADAPVAEIISLSGRLVKRLAVHPTNSSQSESIK